MCCAPFPPTLSIVTTGQGPSQKDTERRPHTKGKGRNDYEDQEQSDRAAKYDGGGVGLREWGGSSCHHHPLPQRALYRIAFWLPLLLRHIHGRHHVWQRPPRRHVRRGWQ